MTKAIEEIIESNSSKEKKLEVLNSLVDEIEFARSVVNGDMKKCEECSEYYNSKSFFFEEKTVEEDVCTYSDPINSGGNEYEKKKVHYVYEVCPKNHKKVFNRIVL